jgi:nickel transport protein
MTSQRLARLVGAAALTLTLGSAQAHNVWLEPDAAGGYLVQFGGHEGQLETYPADKLKSVQAFDRRGRKIEVAVEPRADGVRVKPERQAAMLAAHFDNGFFSKVEGGQMINKPMTENPGATSGVHALKYHKTIIQWGVIAKQPLGQQFEIVALQADTPHAGKPMRVRVLFDGKPIGGIRLSLGEKGAAVNTGADGTATITPVAGTNQLLAIRRVPVANDPRTTSMSWEYLFAFAVH